MKRLIFTAAVLFLSNLGAELFYYPYLSSSAQGTAFAGAAASASDITFQYYNPAAINYHYDKELAIVPSLYWPRSRVTVEGTTLTGDPIPGTTGDRASNSFIPGMAVYGAYAFTDHCHIGISATTPWMMKTQYDQDYVGRYFGYKSEIYSANITPVLAFSWINFISVAAGPQFQFLSFDYKQAIDFGSLAEELSIAGAIPGEQDGYQSVWAGDWSWGWTAGAIVQPCWYLRLGVGYRSEVEHTMHASSRYELSLIGEEVQDALGYYRNGSCDTVKITTPSLWWAGFNYAAHSCWDIVGGISHRGWNGGIAIDYNYIEHPEDIVSPDWCPSMSYSLGARFRPSSQAYVLRAGVQYDEPTLSAEESTPLFYAEKNIQFSCGGEWCLPYGGKVLIAYTHNFMWEAKINQSGDLDINANRGSLNGTAKLDSDILSLQIVKSF